MSCGQCEYETISVFNKSFWDLWAQKMLRNVASIKYQFMVAFFWVIVYGMYYKTGSDGEYLIGTVEGLGFLGGGFISLATARLAARTSLFEPKKKNGELAVHSGIEAAPEQKKDQPLPQYGPVYERPHGPMEFDHEYTHASRPAQPVDYDSAPRLDTDR